jgi:hypothetical protein
VNLPDFNWFDLAELHDQLDSLVCPTHGPIGGEFGGLATSTHFLQVLCRQGCRLGWSKKPRMPEERIERRPYRRPPVPAGEDYCWFCNLPKEVIELLGDKLVWAHKIDRAAALSVGADPKDDDLMLICGFCHRDIDSRRAHTGRFLLILSELRKSA